jgi:hypothetical protein
MIPDFAPEPPIDSVAFDPVEPQQPPPVAVGQGCDGGADANDGYSEQGQGHGLVDEGEASGASMQLCEL